MAVGIGVLGVHRRGERPDRPEERVLQVDVEAGVLYRHRELARERGHDLEVRTAESLDGLGLAHVEHTDDLALGDERHAERRPQPLPPEFGAEAVVLGVDQNERLAVLRDPTGYALSHADVRVGGHVLAQTTRGLDRECGAVGVDEHDRTRLCRGHLHDLVQRPAEHRIEMGISAERPGQGVEG